MTRTERLKLAKAARELAGDVAEGNVPVFEPYNYTRCAIGEVLRRAGIDNPYPGNEARKVEEQFCDGGLGAVDLSQATFHEVGTDYSEHIPGAVVFPLLWLADELVRHD
ncbi:MAG TPA: hypothetical protein VGI97_00495 [Gemmatimonadaceae bacterium]|jgi:hypothetical protein